MAGKVWHGELINKRRDGAFYDEEMTITPVRNKNGEIHNFIAIKQDVSQRKEVELALAHERDLLQALMDSRKNSNRLSLMQKRLGWYDPRVLDTTFACFEIYLPDTSIKSLGRTVAVRDLRVGDVVLSDIQTESGKILVLARSRLTPVLLMRLGNFARFSPIREPIYIEPDASATTA
ncbi:MAG: PAS domain S-box protein [Negativicutes bacterium]|nr:PAS domain S-box protein [Negativicutes bacterium]